MSEFELELGFGRLAAKSHGNPARPPLLALHGWLDNAASFDRLAPLLDRYHVVALDLAGHGRSSHRAAGSWYHHVDHLSDVLEAADLLGWQQFSLLGHSMGAGIASLFAAALPERVQQLLLIEGLGPPSGEPEQAPVQLQRALLQRQGAPAKALRIFPSIELAIAARMQANGLSEPAARLLVERGVVAVEDGYSWSSDPRLTLASPLRYVEGQILAMLGGIRAPTVLVMADPPMPYFKPEIIAARIAAVPQLRLVRLPGTHHLHMEDAPRVAAALLERIDG